ncbi:MAG: hypothetical protein HY986_15565 [Candidatus Melainabacteria bacterium]|nr:hypothetical protein [Candidatus Melainabacteria bacterium]
MANQKMRPELEIKSEVNQCTRCKTVVNTRLQLLVIAGTSICMACLLHAEKLLAAADNPVVFSDSTCPICADIIVPHADFKVRVVALSEFLICEDCIDACKKVLKEQESTGKAISL